MSSGAETLGSLIEPTGITSPANRAAVEGLVDAMIAAQAAQPASMRPENGADLAQAARDYQEAKAHLAVSQRILAREVTNSVDAGMSVAEAARIAGVQRHTVYSWCWEAKR